MFKCRYALLLVIILALLGMGFGVYSYNYKYAKINPAKFNGTLLSKSRVIDDFELTGINQESFTKQNLKNNWTLMFFGFTSCGYVCPTIMSELKGMYEILEQAKVKELPKIVMVSVDPKRDSLEKLNTYVTSFNKNFFGATASAEKLKPLTTELGIAYITITQKNDNYDIEHTGTVMLFNPKGELQAFFTTPQKAQFLADDYMLLTS